MPQPPKPTAHDIAKVVDDLVGALPPDERHAAVTDAYDPAWTDWTYLPGDRPGLPLEAAPDELVKRLEYLVRISHSDRGAELVSGAIEVERERRRLATGTMPTGDRYWFRVFGTPGQGPWAWRLNGHHVGVHVVVDGDTITLTPHFIGAEPARLPEGDRVGHRLLGQEEDAARELLAALTPGGREQAIASDRAPDDILTGADPVADPSVLPDGIRRGDLDARARRTFDSLVRCYLGRAPATYADRCWQEALDLAADDMEFAWAGTTEIGGPHYYCVKTPVFLIEYDNTQDGANHAHSVWRHLRDDFGGDALRAHHRRDH